MDWMGPGHWHHSTCISPLPPAKGNQLGLSAQRVWAILGEDGAGSPLIFGGRKATREIYSPLKCFTFWGVPNFVGFYKPDVGARSCGERGRLLHFLGQILLHGQVLLPAVAQSLRGERGVAGGWQRSRMGLPVPACHTGQQEGEVEGGDSPGCPRVQAGGGQRPAGR